MSDPLHTVTAVDHNALTATHLVKMKGTNLGGPMSEPVQTITAGGGHFGVVTHRGGQGGAGRGPETLAGDPGPAEYILRVQPGGGGRDPVPDRRNGLFYGGHRIAYADAQGVVYGQRVPPGLQDRAGLYRAEYPKTKQVARCGNAVPPPFATALVRANLPEWCGVEINTMEELEKAVAV